MFKEETELSQQILMLFSCIIFSKLAGAKLSENYEVGQILQTGNPRIQVPTSNLVH